MNKEVPLPFSVFLLGGMVVGIALYIAVGYQDLFLNYETSIETRPVDHTYYQNGDSVVISYVWPVRAESMRATFISAGKEVDGHIERVDRLPFGYTRSVRIAQEEALPEAATTLLVVSDAVSLFGTKLGERWHGLKRYDEPKLLSAYCSGKTEQCGKQDILTILWEISEHQKFVIEYRDIQNEPLRVVTFTENGIQKDQLHLSIEDAEHARVTWEIYQGTEIERSQNPIRVETVEIPVSEKKRD